MNELNMAPMAKDPVCGMDVNPEIATAQGLSSEHAGASYYFCGKGCKLDFDENPDKYFAPGYVPSM
jgi:YHS domain-containing protein